MKKFLILPIGLLFLSGTSVAGTDTPHTPDIAALPAAAQEPDETAALAELAALAEKPLPALDSRLSVHDCVHLALINSPKAISARLAVQSAAVALSNAKNVLLPTVSAQISTGFTNTKLPGAPRTSDDSVGSSIDAGLSISGLTDIGRTIRTQKLELERSQLALCNVENEVISSVKSAYYALLAAQRTVEIRTQSRDLYQEQYDRTKAFYDEGLRPKVDVTTAEVDLNNAILSLIRAKNAVKTQNAALANIMGVKYNKEFLLDGNIEQEPFDYTFEQALTQAYENRPDVRSSKTAVQISDIKLRQAKAAYLPTFTLGAAFSKSGDEFKLDSDQTRLFAGVEIPLFSAFKVHNGVKQAQINVAAAQNNDRSLANDVYQEVQNAFVKLNEAAESIPVALSNVEKAKENMELAQGRYNEGIGDMISLKDAQVAYTNAELSLLTSRFDYAVALAELKKSMGAK